jgi:uncharacterized membrane protein
MTFLFTIFDNQPYETMFDTSHFHPMVVHFPIALILVGFLADLIYLFWKKEPCLAKTGFWLMVLGTLGAIAAFTTGEFFTSHPSEGEIAGVFEQHETGAWFTLIVMIAGTALRVFLVAAKKELTSLKWLVFVLYLAGVASVSFTGFIGGYMVYSYMIGL